MFLSFFLKFKGAFRAIQGYIEGHIDQHPYHKALIIRKLKGNLHKLQWMRAEL